MDQLLLQKTPDFVPSVILFNLIFVFALVMIISWVYRKTHRGLSYSQTFNFSLIVIGLLICAVMMVIGSNVAIAFGALGAFSLIRFRTAIKDPKDTVFVFFSVVVGMAVGTANYTVALVLALFVSAVILILDKMNLGTMKKFNYVVSFSVSNNQSSNQEIKDVFKKYTKVDSMLNAVARDQGNVLDMTFYIYLKNNDLVSSFINSLEEVAGVNSVNLTAVKDDIEY